MICDSTVVFVCVFWQVSNEFSGSKKYVLCILKLVARILKSEPLIFSLLPCVYKALKISFHLYEHKTASSARKIIVVSALGFMPVALDKSSSERVFYLMILLHKNSKYELFGAFSCDFVIKMLVKAVSYYFKR